MVALDLLRTVAGKTGLTFDARVTPKCRLVVRLLIVELSADSGLGNRVSMFQF